MAKFLLLFDFLFTCFVAYGLASLLSDRFAKLEIQERLAKVFFYTGMLTCFSILAILFYSPVTPPTWFDNTWATRGIIALASFLFGLMSAVGYQTRTSLAEANTRLVELESRLQRLESKSNG